MARARLSRHCATLIVRLSLACVWLELAGGVLCGQQPRVLLDLRDEFAVRRSVLIQPQEFTPKQAKAMSIEFLKRERGKRRVVKLAIFVDEGDARRTGSGKGTTDVTYSGWRLTYERHGRHLEAMSETVAIGSDVVLRWRDTTGKVGRDILAGGDPLLVLVGGRNFEILELGIWEKPWPYQKPPRETFGMTVYVKTKGLERETVRRCTEVIAHRLGLSRLTCVFRSDTWFITSSGFPIVYRFEPQSVPPTEKEYGNTCGVVCTADGKDVQCDSKVGDCTEFH